MRTDRRTDVTKLIVAFSNCAEAPETYKGKLTLCACDLDAKIRVTSLIVFLKDNWQDYEASNHGVVVNELERYGRKRSWCKLNHHHHHPGISV
jgi:hypothetical protein